MNSSRAWIIAIVIVVGVVWSLSRDDKSTASTRSHSPQRAAKQERPSYPSQQMPHNGSIQSYTYQEKVAPLEIRASSDSNYLVKLVDSSTGTPVMSVFVKRGMTADVTVPLGNYEFRYAAGDTWYGYEHLFGPDTGYSKADKVFSFRDTGYEISGYTVTLYKVPDGNLHTTRMRSSDF